MVVVEGGNVLHCVKGGNCPGGICSWENVRISPYEAIIIIIIIIGTCSAPIYI